MRNFINFDLSDNKVKRIIAGIICIVTVILINLYNSRYSFWFLIPVVGVWFVFFKVKKTREIFNDWFLVFWLFVFYESFRAVAFKFANSVLGLEPIIHGLIKVESTLFFFMDEVPSVWFQTTLRPVLDQPNWYDIVLFFFYGMFFLMFILVAIILWKKKRDLYYRYAYGLVGFSLFDTLIFLFFPSSPPWYAASQGALPYVERILWTTNYFTGSEQIIFNPNDNLFAAFPSHHAAWPFFAVLFLIKAFGKKYTPLMIIPIIIIFATWYGAEHYVIDSIAGVLIATVTYIIVINWEKIIAKFKMSLK